MSKFYSIGVIPSPIHVFKPHQHKTWEIVAYTHGTGTATVGDKEYPFEPGTIICMPPNIDHSERSESGYRNIYIHTDEYPANAGQVPVYADGEERPFYHVAMLLYRESRLRQGNWKLVAQDFFDILMLYLNRWQSANSTPHLVERLKHAIFENLHNPGFDLGAALDDLPLSRDHARKLFVENTGKTPLQYLTALRVDEAQHLLRYGGYSVKEISRRVGYEDPYYFSRLFKKWVGVSPENFART
ncbi:MAG: helix-turn-helix transcriptional regulator [Planctomycetota bacterium]|nr:helix-turn-helix transcriptional regulator [Planctomycetota bacterium]